MIVILAGDQDPLANAVRAELDLRGHDYGVIGADWVPGSELAWTPIPFGGSIKADGRTVALGSITGVLVRTELAPHLPTTLERGDDQYPFFESGATLLGLLDAMPCIVVNRPVPLPQSRVAAISPELARAAGCASPPTIVSSERDAALGLVDDESLVVVGRVSGPYEDRLVSGAAQAAEAIDALLPHGAVLLKRLVPGPLIQAFVAGTAVLGARWAAGALTPSALEPRAARAARAVADQLGVELVRVTLQLSPDRVWLVDVNPHVFLPGGGDSDLVAPAAAGITDLLSGAPR